MLACKEEIKKEVTVPLTNKYKTVFKSKNINQPTCLNSFYDLKSSVWEQTSGCNLSGCNCICNSNMSGDWTCDDNVNDQWLPLHGLSR